MAGHSPFRKHTKDWSPERRARFETEYLEQEANLRAGRVPGKPAHGYPVAREEIDRLAPAMLRVFERLALHLDLLPGERMELLGLAGDDNVPAVGAITEEQFYRLSYLIGIWLDLGAAFGGKEGIVSWLRSPVHDEERRGRSRVDFLIGEGLAGFDQVRREAAYWANNGW